MKAKIAISTIVAFLISFMLSPPDLVSQIILGFVSALLCFIPLLILARCKFMKSSPNTMHTLVCILVCMVSFLSVHWILSQKRIAEYAHSSSNSSVVSISQ
jgi:integral membrane sensor domain MASE1